jgi:hypothetical protein
MTAETRTRFVEVVSVLVILTSLVALGIPMSADYRRREAAKRMLADVELVRQAVYRFYSDSAVFPPEAPDGQFSDELAFYLPPTFSRTRPYGTIEYRNWPLRPPTDSTRLADTTGAAKPAPAAPNVIALAIVPRDPKVAAAASAIAYEMPQFTMGGRFFFVLFGS